MRWLRMLLLAFCALWQQGPPHCDSCEAEAQAFIHPYAGCHCGRDVGPST